MDRQIDGLLLARGIGTSGAGELARRGVRILLVLINSATAYPGYTTIGPAAADGTDAAVDHLLRVHDHSSVSLILGDTVDAGTDSREAGWLNGPRPEPAVPDGASPFSRTGGYDAGMRLLQQPGRPTAVVTGSDLQAVGLLRATRKLGLGVPEDVALTERSKSEHDPR